VKRSKDIRWAEVRVGIFFIVALVLLALAVVAVGRKVQLFTPKAKVQVLLPNVQGLKVGAPVWLSGVMIGTVSDVSFAAPVGSDQVIVTLDIDSAAAVRLGNKAVVTVRSRGLLGEKYVDIVPGGQLGEVPKGPIHGTPTIGVDEVMAEAYSSFSRLQTLIDAMQSRQGTLGRFLKDPALYDNLVRLSGRLQQLVASATGGKGSLARIINDPTLYRRLVAFSDKGGKAADQLDALARSLQDPNGTLSRLAHDPRLYDQTLEAAQQTRKTLKDLDAILAKINRGQGSAGKLVESTALHDQLVKTLADLDALVKDMQTHPGRYVKFSLF